jgi:hypothetical protein
LGGILKGIRRLGIDSKLLEIGRSAHERVPGEIENVLVKRKCQIVIN